MCTKRKAPSADRWFVCIGLACLSIAVLSATPAPGQEKKLTPQEKEAGKLQGKWQLESLVVRGSALGADQVKGRTLVIEGNTIRHTAGGRDLERGTVALDPAKKPPTIDQTFDKGGSLGGMTLKGLYRMDGDTLTICNGPLGKDRPSDLISKPGSGDSLFIYSRAKKDGKLAPLPEDPAFGQAERGATPALLKARLDAAQKAYGAAMEGLQQTKKIDAVLLLKSNPEEVYTWSVRWLRAQQGLSNKKEDHIAALKDHLKRMKELQQRVTKLHEGGLISAIGPPAAAWYVAEAELWLASQAAAAEPNKGREPFTSKVGADTKELLKGSWSLTFVERDGKKTSVGSTGTTTLNPLTIAFDGAKFHITYPGQSGEILGSYTLLAHQKTVDLDFLVCRDTISSPVGAGRTDKCLCQIEGDTLKLASYGLGYHLRPKSFQDTRTTVLWLQRVNPIDGKKDEASAQVNLVAKVSAYVQKVHVDVGDRVKKGQLLAELFAPELDAELQRHAKVNEHAKVYAPFDCVVVKRNAVKGMFVNVAVGNAEPLFVVVRLGGEPKKEQEPKNGKAEVPSPDVSTEVGLKMKVARLKLNENELELKRIVELFKNKNASLEDIGEQEITVARNRIVVELLTILEVRTTHLNRMQTLFKAGSVSQRALERGSQLVENARKQLEQFDKSER